MKYITYIHYVCILKPEFILAYIITSTFTSSLKKFLQINFFKYLFQLSQRNTYEKKNEVSFKLQIIKKKIIIEKNGFCSFPGFKEKMHSDHEKLKPSLSPRPERSHSEEKVSSSRTGKFDVLFLIVCIIIFSKKRKYNCFDS